MAAKKRNRTNEYLNKKIQRLNKKVDLKKISYYEYNKLVDALVEESLR